MPLHGGRDVCLCSERRAILNHQGSFGEIRMTVRYATLKNRLIVVVDSCR